jgi:hypothetical protein
VSEVGWGNIRVALLVSAAGAAGIWSLLAADYFPHYAVAAWTVDVTVARYERYT